MVDALAVYAPEILIIEDDDALRGELVELLKALGAVVTGVGDGAAAVASSRAQAFDLVLCDYKLRNENGLDVLKALSGATSAPLPDQLYLMTAHLDLTQAARAEIAASTRGLLMKPIRLADLRHLVATAGGAPC